MRRAVGVAGVVLLAAGCGWLSRSPLLSRNQPPPPPVTHSSYRDPAWSWESVDRLGVRGFLGEHERKGLARRSARHDSSHRKNRRNTH